MSKAPLVALPLAVSLAILGLACRTSRHVDATPDASDPTDAGMPTIVPQPVAVADAGPEDGDDFIDPSYAAVGDAFRVIATSVDATCEPKEEWDPAGLVEKRSERLVAPRFPTPLRSYHAHYRAAKAGATSLRLVCTRTNQGRLVAKRALVIVEPADAEAFVGFDNDLYGSEIPAVLEDARAAMTTCFAAELAKDPKVRGHGAMQIFVRKDGALSFPLDRADVTGSFSGVPKAMAECATKAVADAVARRPRVDLGRPAFQSDYFKENGASVSLRIRLEVRPKAIDATLCKRYGERWAKCRARASSATADTQKAIAAREKVATSPSGKKALGWGCDLALRELDDECPP